MKDEQPSTEGTSLEAEPEVDTENLFGIIADGVVGAAGGLVGTAMMAVVLLIAESFGAFSRESFAGLAALAGLDGVLPAVAAGFALFLLGGMFPWPLLFASLGKYLPGESRPVNGIFFGTALWTGFVLAFYDGYVGTALALYVGFTLLAHWVYGISLGLVVDYLSTRPDTLV